MYILYGADIVFDTRGINIKRRREAESGRERLREGERELMERRHTTSFAFVRIESFTSELKDKSKWL